MEQSSSSSPVKYVSKHTGEEIDSLLDKVKLDLVDSDLKKQVEDNTTAIGQEVEDRTNLDTTLTAAIKQEAAAIEKLVPKENINTSTFDPTSDNPAGQKSIAEMLEESELDNRLTRAYQSKNYTCTFMGLPSFITKAYFTYKIGLFDFVNNPGIDHDCFGLFHSCTSLKEIDSYGFSSIINLATNLYCGFRHCPNLEKIGSKESPFDLTNCKNLMQAFQFTSKLKEIHMINISVSFDISDSTAFEESNLVEILSGLMDLTGKTSQTLTMGATNLAKLTDADKAIATNKNWVLA